MSRIAVSVSRSALDRVGAAAASLAAGVDQHRGAAGGDRNKVRVREEVVGHRAFEDHALELKGRRRAPKTPPPDPSVASGASSAQPDRQLRPSSSLFAPVGFLSA